MSIQAAFTFNDGSHHNFTIIANTMREVLTQLADQLPPAERHLIASAKPASASRASTTARGRGGKRGARAPRVQLPPLTASAQARGAAHRGCGRAAPASQAPATTTRTTRASRAAQSPDAAASATPHSRPGSHASRAPETGVPGNPWNDPRRGPPGCPHLPK